MATTIVERLASAAAREGLHHDWSRELAANVVAAAMYGEDAYETARDGLERRIAFPGAGRPAAFHHELRGVDVERVARAMADAYAQAEAA